MRQNHLASARPPTPQIMLRHAHNPRAAFRRRVAKCTFCYNTRRLALTPAPASYTFPPLVPTQHHPNPLRLVAPDRRPPAVQPPLRGDSFVPLAPSCPPLRSPRSCAQLYFSARPLRAEPGVPNTRNGRSGGRTFIKKIPSVGLGGQGDPQITREGANGIRVWGGASYRIDT